MKTCYVIQMTITEPNLHVFKEGEEVKMLETIEASIGKIVDEDSKKTARNLIEHKWDKIPWTGSGHIMVNLWGLKGRVSIFKGMMTD